MFEQHYNLILAKILFFSHIRTKRKLKLLAHLLIVLVAPLCVHMGYQVCQTQKKDQSREHRKVIKIVSGGFDPSLLALLGGRTEHSPCQRLSSSMLTPAEHNPPPSHPPHLPPSPSPSPPLSPQA